MQRRNFLQSTAAFGAAELLGCREDAPSPRFAGDPGATNDPADTPGIELVPFEEEAGPFGVAEGEGLGGRLYTELSTLGEASLITPNEQFYIRTRYPALLDPSAPWSLRLGGLVEQPQTLALDEVLALEREQGVFLLECSGNFRARGFGLLSAALWHGVPLLELLERARPSAEAARVLITGSDAHAGSSGGSTQGASWIVSPEQIERTGAFLATRMNGEPLPLDHGFPLRLFNPGWYGCSCIKWVESIEWVADDAASTSQMIEFSARTHQLGEPALARDYAAPEIQQAAMPIRVEKRRLPGAIGYRVVGIVWGGSEPVTQLGLSFDGGNRFETFPVASATQNQTWSLWRHDWFPTTPGEYSLVCRVDNPTVPMRRLDSGYYTRRIRIDAV